MGVVTVKLRWERVEHDPVWVAAPLRVDRDGTTKSGFLCIHDLENGKGLCGGNTFTPDGSKHSCLIAVRAGWKISRPCYDKYRRCPGWAGGGWKHAKYRLCHGDFGDGGYLSVDYEDRWWKWKTHKCPTCGVVVLPYITHRTSWRSWWSSIRYARNSWMWLIRLEIWWDKKRGER